jgi:hypothetical protein
MNKQTIERTAEGLRNLNQILETKNELNHKAAALYHYEYNEGMIGPEEYLNRLLLVQKHAQDLQDDTEYLKHMVMKLAKKAEEISSN